MSTITVIYLLIAVVSSVFFVYFQYFFKEKRIANRNVLAVLRLITFLLLFVLLINPKIERKKFITVKPELVIAVDNSESIQINKQDSLVRSFYAAFQSNKDLQKKFNITSYSFGSLLQKNSDFSFRENKTNISTALTELNKLYKNKTAAIVLISDGNQTYGDNYQYFKSAQAIYPVVVGDKVQPSDLKIDRVNVNSFSYLHHNFPVEVFIHFSGKEAIRSKFVVKAKSKIIFSKELSFSKSENSKIVSFKLPSESVGKHLFAATIIPFKKEKNTINNTKNFTVEVIDEQSNIALVYDVLHPDIGMLKRSIETNKQRKVNLINLNGLQTVATASDVYILYQPNTKFKSIFKDILDNDKSYFIITGTQTDWNFLNGIQEDFKGEITQSVEKFYPSMDTNFNTFIVEDIEFSEFPPLENLFGTVKFSVSKQDILKKSVNGIEMKSPLLSVYNAGDSRRAVLFGENIWKWRSAYFVANNSFELFDQFINNIIQFLSIYQQKIPIELKYNSFYHANEQIKITARTYDSNFNFDRNAELELKIKGKEEKVPFVLTNSGYEAIIDHLKSGEYEFVVKDMNKGNQIKGMITVGEFSVEQELTYSNFNDLNTIARSSNGKLFYPKQKNDLIKQLLQNKKFVSIQKEELSEDSLIDWRWLLGLIIVSLTTEWFIRKYRGLV